MKKVFRTIHLYLSLAAGLVIFSSCLTGTMLVFEEELEHLFHNDRYYVKAKGERKPVDELVTTALRKVKGARPASVKVYKDRGRTVEIGLITPGKPGERGGAENGQPAAGSRGKFKPERKGGRDDQPNRQQDAANPKKGGEKGRDAKPSLTVYVNPYSGEVVDVFNKRSSFLFQAEMFHRFLLTGKDSLGNTVVAVCTLFFLFILITGLILWWPKTKAIMRQRLKIKFSGNTKRLVNDLHIVTGFYTSVFLIVIVLTGLIMTFDWANKVLFSLTGSKVVKEQPKPPLSGAGEGRNKLAVDDIITTISSQFERAAYLNVRLPKDSTGVYSVQLINEGQVETTGDTYFIDQYDGHIAGRQLFAEKNKGQQARAFVKPIHTGSVYGLPTKIISFIVCLLSLIFPVTGVMMWLNRTRKPGKRKVPDEAEDALAAAVL